MVCKTMQKLEEENRQQGCGVKFDIGDSVKVHTKIREGDKDRIQIFMGTVISRKGRGSQACFTVRRVSHGVGVEKIFPISSPAIAKVEVQRGSEVRRAKLYFLRDLSGKKARLRESAQPRSEQ